MANNLDYKIDENLVRTALVKSVGDSKNNWLFIPGGPGCDSSYFLGLIELLNCPGNYWLIDLPGNGTNKVENYDYNKWLEIFVPTVSKFENPIIVGHSFGGMLPLLFPELENIAKGFIALNSTPSMWLEETVVFAKKYKLPDFSKEMAAFVADHSQENFDAVLDACMPYYFPPETLEEGAHLLKGLHFAFAPSVWWQIRMLTSPYNAKWIPQNAPMMAINAEFDSITPYTVYANDERFDRPNISREYIKGAGHFPFIEKPNEVVKLFDKFAGVL